MKQVAFFASGFTLLLLGYVVCQSGNELDVDDLEKKINTIPGLEQFNSSQLPNEEDLDRVLKEKCEKSGGGEEAYLALKNQQSTVQSCLEQHLNATQIQLEVEEAKKTGSMDEVFGKYCRKYPDIYKCFESVTESIKPCLTAEEQEAMNKALNVTGELREFVCFKDGDRIAMFIAEGGVECLESRKDELQECANKTLGARIPTNLSVNNLPMFLFSERDCNDFDSIRTCVNSELEKCKDSTPANIVDAFFKFLKKHTPCEITSSLLKATAKESTTGSSNVVTTSTVVLLVTLVIAKMF